MKGGTGHVVIKQGAGNREQGAGSRGNVPHVVVK